MQSVVLLACMAAQQTAYPVNTAAAKDVFWGLGGLSAGASSRLLLDYVEPQRSQILDYLFLPNFGASLQILKVEIGGDSQSTDGTETSHMHSKDDLDVTRGYEWWLMKEAKARNPKIKLYGLPWAFPGWVGNDPVTGKPSGSPFTYPNQTALYIKNWIVGAKQTHGLDIDYIGVWNERSSSAAYAVSLKKTLADAGFPNIKLVAKDGGADICATLQKDPAYADAVDIIGLHYPSDYSNYSDCHALNKPFWSSEESSSYDDYNGAACWARVVNSHYVLSGMTSSIMWSLVGAYYHGTNWYASGLLTSVQPWSGHYSTFEVVWATAHVTQFTQVGWKYLSVGSGSGELTNGGFYTTIVDTEGTDVTMMIAKVSHEHAACTRPGLPAFDVSAENATFTFAGLTPNTNLAVWRSNYENNVTQQFEYMGEVTPVNGQVTVEVNVGDYITLTTVKTGKKGQYTPSTSVPFPLPHVDDFSAVADGQEGKYLTDQIGAFEVHSGSLRQMVPQLPIGWSDHGSNGPMTLIGMKEFQDIRISTRIHLPSTDAAGCVATRVNQMWTQGVVLCLYGSGEYTLSYGGPALGSGPPSYGTSTVIKSGKVQTPPGNLWFALQLETVASVASASYMTLTEEAVASGAWRGRVQDLGETLFTNEAIENYDNGFAALGANAWLAVEYDDVNVTAAGPNWNPTSPCAAAKQGTVLTVLDCVSNGLALDYQSFDLRSNWQIVHRASGLCVSMNSTDVLTLEVCLQNNTAQQFENDYTHIRNEVDVMHILGNTKLMLVGHSNGSLTIADSSAAPSSWQKWSYYPNTFQVCLRSEPRTFF